MKDHYDFSQAIHGKYTARAGQLKLPIYLDPEVEAAMERLAASTDKDVNDLVNSMLKNDLDLLKAMTKD